MTPLRREIVAHAAYDKRNKTGGIHGVNLVFYLHGPKGTIQFVIYTNWHTPEVQRELDGRMPDSQFPYLMHEPMAADLGCHARSPMYEGQDLFADSCSVLGGEPCYYSGTGLGAERIFDVLRREGSEGVWRELEKTYNDWLEAT